MLYSIRLLQSILNIAMHRKRKLMLQKEMKKHTLIGASMLKSLGVYQNLSLIHI